MPDNLTDLIQRAIDAIQGLGIFLPIAIFVIANIFSGKDKDKKKQEAPKPQPAPTRAAPKPVRHAPPDPASPGPVVSFPFGPPAWMEMMAPESQSTQTAPTRRQEPQSQWGHTFEKQDSEKDVLKWGSVFEDDEGEPLRWESAFESERGKNTYGFEKATYGQTFPKKSTEPVVNFG